MPTAPVSTDSFPGRPDETGAVLLTGSDLVLRHDANLWIECMLHQNHRNTFARNDCGLDAWSPSEALVCLFSVPTLLVMAGGTRCIGCASFHGNVGQTSWQV